jgi:hypothetical protein
MKLLWISLLLPSLLLRGQDAVQPPVVPPPLEQPPARAGLTIIADFTEIDLKSNTVYYSNNVVVTDPPAKPGDFAIILKCRELTAARNATGQVEHITAIGDVQIDQGDKHARGQKAIYTGADERVVLTGPWPHEPLPSDRPLAYSSQYTNSALEIIYDRRSGKFFGTQVKTIIDPSVLSGGTNRAPGLFNAPPTTKSP